MDRYFPISSQAAGANLVVVSGRLFNIFPAKVHPLCRPSYIMPCVGKLTKEKSRVIKFSTGVLYQAIC
jgi:hypothetical protein